MPLILQVAGTAAAWVVLFELNSWFFASFEWTRLINWVFLPAGARLLSVMALGRRGALGLWLGAMVTNRTAFNAPLGQSLTVATLSAGAPLIAVYVGMRWLKVPLGLHGLTAGQLMKFALLGAACSVVLHNLFFWAVGIESNPLQGLAPMFVGDLIGTFLVLYTLHAALLIIERFVRIPTP